MQNMNVALNNSCLIANEDSHSLTKNAQKTNTPIYLKDGLQRHQYFIQERRRNIKQLNMMKSHMHASRKICPKPWHWGRFYKIFHPMYESYWLNTWWEKTDEEKRDQFFQQLEYLAMQTIKFNDAYAYLSAIEEQNWYFRSPHSIK